MGQQTNETISPLPRFHASDQGPNTACRQRIKPVVKSTTTATVTVTAHRDLAGVVDFMVAEW
jgi:hypothetical protein